MDALVELVEEPSSEVDVVHKVILEEVDEDDDEMLVDPSTSVVVVDPSVEEVGQSDTSDQKENMQLTGRPRRQSAKKIASFAEPSLNKKLRQGDKFTFHSTQ